MPQVQRAEAKKDKDKKAVSAPFWTLQTQRRGFMVQIGEGNPGSYMGLTHYEMVDTPLSCRTFCATWQLASHCSRVFVWSEGQWGTCQPKLLSPSRGRPRSARPVDDLTDLNLNLNWNLT